MICGRISSGSRGEPPWAVASGVVQTSLTTMFILSFHGGTGTNDLNNLHAYNDDGSPANPDKLLAHGGGGPDLNELRAFAFRPEGLYVVNGNKDASQLLLYTPGTNGQFSFSKVIASKQSVNGILHPFDIACDTCGNVFVSSQDTNVVTALAPNGVALPPASYLTSQYPAATFLAGTLVASSLGNLPLNPGNPPPPNVPPPQGLAVTLDKGKVAHSVRGVVWTGGYLLVADEPDNAVKVYDATGQLQGQIAGNGLSAPVHLLLQGETLYVSSSNDTIYTSPVPEGGSPGTTVAPTPWLTDHLHSPAGMCFDSAGNFYVALRKDKEVRYFDTNGKYLGHFISGLSDEPEFIAYQA